MFNFQLMGLKHLLTLSKCSSDFLNQDLKGGEETGAARQGEEETGCK